MSVDPVSDALDLSPVVRERYLQLLAADGRPFREVAERLRTTPEQLQRELDGMFVPGVVTTEAGVLHVASPQRAVSLFLIHQTNALHEATGRLARVAGALPQLGEALAGDLGERDGTIDADVVSGGDVIGLLVSWIEQSQGDIVFLRPDQWVLPSESAMSAAVTTAVQQGRRVRAIYPARALKEAPEVLMGRAAIGEEVRLLPHVPTRLAIVGRTRALMPEVPGTDTGRRVVLRHPGLIVMLQHCFDGLWDAGTALAPLGRATHDAVGPEGQRRLLLNELSRGARDEQIARDLGLSLRTVRRRIADLMAELGVDTRFQAGVEATRRGWT